MSADRSRNLGGGASFGPFLRRECRRVKGIYTFSMCSWTVIHGLPLVVGLVISRLIDGAGSGAVNAGAWGLLGLAIGLMLLRAGFLMVGLRLTFTLIFRVSSRIKLETLGRILRTPSTWTAARGDGDILNRLREDTDEIGGLLEWTTDLIYRSVLVIAAVVVLVVTDALLVLPLLLLLGGLGASVYLKRRVAILQGEIRQQQGEIAAAMTDTLTGIRDLRLSDTVGGRVAALDARFAARRRTQVRHQIFADLLADLFRYIVVAGISGVLLIVSARVVSGDFSVGQLVLFLTYTAWLGEQMFFFGYIVARLQSAEVSYGRLNELVAEVAPIPAEPLAEQGGPLADLEISVPASPAGGDPASPVHLAIRPGQLVALTGEIGSGKSTFVRNVLAMRPQAPGSVRWNGAELADRLSFLRSPQVGYVRQSPRFLRGTVRENLALGAPEVTDEVLERALAAVWLSPGSAGLPDGLQTRLDSGEARQISGGQRQRLAMARMLCHPAQLYVVDDCDSSVDAETARHLWKTLPTQWPGAWIVVSHNPDLLTQADTVLVFQRFPHGT